MFFNYHTSKIINVDHEYIFKKLPNCWGVNGVPSINVAAEVIEPSFSAVAAAFRAALQGSTVLVSEIKKMICK